MKKNYVVLLFALLVVITRLLPHAPNIAPIGALALLLGRYYKPSYATLMIIAVMLATDSVIGFHSFIPWVYGSYLLIVGVAYGIRRLVKGAALLVLPLLSSFLFYLVTNFGVWLTTAMYPKTVSGLLECYTLALPFFHNTLLGDYLFTLTFFSLYSLLLQNKQAHKKSYSLATV